MHFILLKCLSLSLFVPLLHRLLPPNPPFFPPLADLLIPLLVYFIFHLLSFTFTCFFTHRISNTV